MSSDNKTQSYVVNSFLENNSYFHKNAKFAEGKRRHSAGLLAGTRRAPARFVFAYRFFRYAARSGVPAASEPRRGGTTRRRHSRAREDCAASPKLPGFSSPDPPCSRMGFLGLCRASGARPSRRTKHGSASARADEADCTAPDASACNAPAPHTSPRIVRRRVPAPRSIPSLPHPPASPCRGASERTAERHSPVRPHRTARRRNPDASARASEHPPARAFSGRSRNVRASERRHNSPRLRRSLMFRARAAGTGLRPRMTYPRFRYAFPKRGTSAGKGQPQGVPAGALISRS